VVLEELRQGSAISTARPIFAAASWRRLAESCGPKPCGSARLSSDPLHLGQRRTPQRPLVLSEVSPPSYVPVTGRLDLLDGLYKDMKSQKRRAPQSRSAPTTPAVVAEFGAKCVRSGGLPGLEVVMNNAEQADLLRAPGLRQTLLEYCIEAQRRGTEDRSHLPLSDLFWLGDAERNRVSALGPKRAGRVFNLLDANRRVIDDRTPKLQKVQPFGRPLKGATWAVFLDLSTGDRPYSAGFRYGRIVGGDSKVALIDSDHVRFKVPTPLVAPGALAFGDVDTTDAARHVPPSGEAALARLDELKGACLHDAYTALIIRNAMTAVDASGISAQGEKTVSRLQDGARALRGAARYLRGGLGSCDSSATPDKMESIAGDLDVLACRVRVAYLTGRPEVLHSPTDEVLYRQLLDIEGERGHDSVVLEAVATCLSTLARTRSTLASRLRAKGLASEEHRVANEDFAKVTTACRGGADSERAGAMQHLARMAEERNLNGEMWSIALGLAQKKEGQESLLTRECEQAARAVQRKIEDSACRALYRSVLAAHGKERNESRDETNASLAREAVVLLESSGHGEHFDNPALARCILRDDREIHGKIEVRLRAATLDLGDKETTAQIDELELKTRGDLARAQETLQETCQRSQRSPQNPLPPEASVQGVLAPLLRKQGRVELIEVMRAVPEAEALLDAPAEGETRNQESARRRCASALKEFEARARRELCRLRLMRKLNVPPAASDVQLAAKWLYRSEKGQVAAGEQKELDELCVQTLDAEGTKVRQRAALSSVRTCPDLKTTAVLERFCAQLAHACVPVNFLDFLSLLLLSALPAWPSTQTTMKAWLETRRNFDGAAEALTCSNTAKVIELHAADAAGSSAGHEALRRGITSVLDALQGGLELESLSKCACSSPGVLTAATRQELTRATRWYWETGSAIMVQGYSDAVYITEARQDMVTDFLDSVLESVSWTGAVTLRVSERPILRSLWTSYLRQLFAGHLTIFRARIMEQRDVKCQLALVDTLFFVVALDLVDLSKHATVSQEKHIASVAARMALTREGVAQAALGVAAAAGLAGATLSATGLAAKLGTTAVGAAKAATSLGTGAAGVAFAHELAKELYRRHLKPQTFSQRLGPKKENPEGSFGATYRQLFSTAFVSKKEAVRDLLLKLCAKAIEESKWSKGALEPGALSRLHQWERVSGANGPGHFDIEAPLYFPLGPPGAIVPSAACWGNVC
jgi:hypothetical protein